MLKPNKLIFDSEDQYQSHKVNCDFMDAKISKNVAILSGKVTYDNNFTKLNADKIEYDLLKRTSKISMFNKDGKVKITYKK